MIHAVSRKRVKSNSFTLDPADTVISSAADHDNLSTWRATWIWVQIPEATIQLFISSTSQHDMITLCKESDILKPGNSGANWPSWI